jgi:D-alanyl-D-alanine carboxypeptidase/D-alanyl-D-alanine-endopeptidase (penicillin-binding protein 4)
LKKPSFLTALAVLPERLLMMKTLRCLIATLAILCAFPSTLACQAKVSLAERTQAIMSRPEFVHSSFGIEFYSLDHAKIIYQFNADKLMVPGSTTKLLTEGTMLELLGGDYRFHTRVYRTGPIKKDGTLDGDIVIVASGDPNLSGRIQSDGTLAYENMDHSYGGPDSKGLGDPLLVVRELAQQIADKGIRRVKGRVLVDVSLFPEGDRELGTNVVISPIVVNDNVVDVIATGGDKEGAPVTLQISPKTAYLQIINQATTGKADSKADLNYTADKANPDGTRSVTVTGTLPPGKGSGMMAYPVPEPSRFAATVLAETLKEKGIDIPAIASGKAPDFKLLASSYQPESLIAEHVSPPLKEDVKITLKLSQNLHASMGPFLLGALLAHKDKEIDQAGFDLEREFLKKADLDLTAASQSDGAGGNAFFTPDFMVRYLTFMSARKDFGDFQRGLPILGRDGTLSKIQVNSPAAGHVYAKTGTYDVYDALNKNLMVTGKGLAGYMETTGGEHVAFAGFINMVSAPMDDPEAVQRIAGEALGEIAAAAYDGHLLSAPAPTANAPFDVIIRNGRIIDGSGNPWVSGDVAIRGDRIAAIGNLTGAKCQARHRCERAGGCSRLHRYVGSVRNGIADRQSFLEQAFTGNHDRNHGGRRFGCSPEPAHLSPTPTRPGPVSPEGGLVHAGRVLCAARKIRHAPQHRNLRRRSPDPGNDPGGRESSADAGRTRPDEGAGRAGHAGRSVRHFHRAHLSSRTLR